MGTGLSQQLIHQPFQDDTAVSPVFQICVPFNSNMSKNRLYRMGKGNYYKTDIGKGLQADVELLSHHALRGELLPKDTKIWVDIHVEKPNHRSDAANVLDLIFDGLKKGIGRDDRWFSIYRLDWSICTIDPQIYIGVGL